MSFEVVKSVTQCQTEIIVAFTQAKPTFTLHTTAWDEHSSYMMRERTRLTTKVPNNRDIIVKIFLQSSNQRSKTGGSFWWSITCQVHKRQWKSLKKRVATALATNADKLYSHLSLHAVSTHTGSWPLELGIYGRKLCLPCPLFSQDPSLSTHLVFAIISKLFIYLYFFRHSVLVFVWYGNPKIPASELKARVRRNHISNK